MGYEKLPFVLVDQTTGEQISVTEEEWNRIVKLAAKVDADDDITGQLPNSTAGTPSDLGKFFDDLLKTLVDALNLDARTTGRAAVADAEKRVYSPRSAVSQAMADALTQLSTLSPAELRKAKALGSLYRRPDENVQKAQLREDNSGQPTAEECADLMATIESNARKTFRKNSVTLT